MPSWCVSRLSTPQLDRYEIIRQRRMRQTLSMSSYKQDHASSSSPLSHALLSIKELRCAHDATCSNVMRTGGLDAPFPFYLFFFFYFMTFACIRTVMRLSKKKNVFLKIFHKVGGGVVFEVSQIKKCQTQTYRSLDTQKGH